MQKRPGALFIFLLMKRLVTIAALAFAVNLPTAVLAAPSKANCKAMFDKMDANKNGYLDGKEAERFAVAMQEAGRTSGEADTNADGKIDEQEFLAACESGDLPTLVLPIPSEAECKAMFNKMDENKNGFIDGKEAAPFNAAMQMAGRTSGEADTNSDGKIDEMEFLAVCESGDFIEVAK